MSDSSWQEKIGKLQMDVHQARGKYQEKAKELEEDLPRYEHEMRSEYVNTVTQPHTSTPAHKHTGTHKTLQASNWWIYSKNSNF